MWTLSRVRREGWGESLSRGHIIFSGLMHLLLLFVSFRTQSSSQSPRLKTFTLSLAFYSFSFASTNNHLPNFLDLTSSFLSCHEWLDYISTTLVTSFFTFFLQLYFRILSSLPLNWSHHQYLPLHSQPTLLHDSARLTPWDTVLISAQRTLKACLLME